MPSPFRCFPRRLFPFVFALVLSCTAQAGDRLLATGGAHQIEGAAGGGLVPWALIAGYGTRDQAGGSAFYTRVDTQDFNLVSYGVALGLWDRVEVSFARQALDASSVVPNAIGARSGSDTDFYDAATKVWLAGFLGRNVLANATVRATRANQFGLLGFGGDRKSSRSLQPEASLAVMLTDNLVLGGDYRRKPDNLSVFKEEDASDVFLAWFPHRNVAVTLAWAKLGTVAGKAKQDGTYLSLQLTL